MFILKNTEIAVIHCTCNFPFIQIRKIGVVGFSKMLYLEIAEWVVLRDVISLKYIPRTSKNPPNVWMTNVGFSHIENAESSLGPGKGDYNE